MIAMRVRNSRVEAGFGLVELMIGILIGTFLLLGLAQVFSTSRTAYQTSEGIARVQENSRFAMDFLERDLRMVGHMGCVNDVSTLDTTLTATGQTYLNTHFLSSADRQAKPQNWLNAPFGERFNISVEGFEANNSGLGQTVDLSAASDPMPLGAATDWTPNLPADLTGKVIKGSDVLVVRFFDYGEIPVSAINFTVAPVQITIPAAYAAQVKAGTLYGIADCNHATVFQATTSANVGTGIFTVDSTGLNLSGFGINDDTYQQNEKGLSLFPLRSVAYYVGQGTGGQASLMRLNYGSGAPVVEELVSGIENMQILYGRDTNGGEPDGGVDTYQTAQTINALSANHAADWLRVGTVRIGFISRSTGRGDVNPATVVNPQIVGVTVKPPSATPADNRVRQPYVTTVALRNRLFGN